MADTEKIPSGSASPSSERPAESERNSCCGGSGWHVWPCPEFLRACPPSSGGPGQPRTDLWSKAALVRLSVLEFAHGKCTLPDLLARLDALREACAEADSRLAAPRPQEGEAPALPVRLEVVTTIGGDVLLCDADDEGTPICKFVQGYDESLRIAQAIVTRLASPLPPRDERPLDDERTCLTRREVEAMLAAGRDPLPYAQTYTTAGAASPRPGAEATSEDTRDLRKAVSGLRAFARYFAKGMRDSEGHLWQSANAVVFAYEAIERHLAARSSSGVRSEEPTE
jgi:hypothetical protein